MHCLTAPVAARAAHRPLACPRAFPDTSRCPAVTGRVADLPRHPAGGTHVHVGPLAASAARFPLEIAASSDRALDLRPVGRRATSGLGLVLAQLLRLSDSERLERFKTCDSDASVGGCSTTAPNPATVAGVPRNDAATVRRRGPTADDTPASRHDGLRCRRQNVGSLRDAGGLRW